MEDRQGRFKQVDFPGSEFSILMGVNDNAVICGYYGIGNSFESGFIVHAGKFLAISPPGAAVSTALGINSLGQIAGYFAGEDGVAHGFLWTPPTAHNESKQ
jgi:probable HAF family extracellular repeat protein